MLCIFLNTSTKKVFDIDLTKNIDISKARKNVWILKDREGYFDGTK